MAKQSKRQKANWMWIEQFFYKLDALEKQISDISIKVAYDIAELQKRIEVLENAKDGRPEH